MKFLFLCILLIAFSKSCDAQCALPAGLQKIFMESSQETFSLDGNDIPMHRPWLVVEDSLRNLTSCPAYKAEIDRLIRSDNIKQRSLAYMTLFYAADSGWNALLIDRLYSDTAADQLTWIALVLMATNATSAADKLFQTVLNPALPGEHLIPMFISMDSADLKPVFKAHLSDTSMMAKILAMQGLASYGPDKQVDSLARVYVQEWDIEHKGYAISTLGQLKSGNLKSLLLPYLAVHDLEFAVIRALQASPTKEDRELGNRLYKVRERKAEQEVERKPRKK